jgi:hypothetical protein
MALLVTFGFKKNVASVIKAVSLSHKDLGTVSFSLSSPLLLDRR